jgi:hypothetical protein
LYRRPTLFFVGERSEISNQLREDVEKFAMEIGK